MLTTALGSTGLTTSALGLGCMPLSRSYGAPPNPEAALATLQHAFDLGIRFWDTADAYALNDNERLVGRALARTDRDEIVLATKFGGVFDPDTGQPVGVRGDADHVRKACDASLQRLGTDHIDLYFQHLPDPEVPVEETVAAMADLVTSGKIRHIGLSNIDAGALRRAHAVHPISAVQSEWSLFVRGAEQALVPTCVELGIGFVPYSPLGRGFLTGVTAVGADDERAAFPWFSPENAVHNSALLTPLHRIAREHGAAPSQVALAWLRHRADAAGVTAVPIPGTRRAHRLTENAAAFSLTLAQQDLADLDPVAGRVSGSRKPELPPELRHFMPDDHAVPLA